MRTRTNRALLAWWRTDARLPINGQVRSNKRLRAEKNKCGYSRTNNKKHLSRCTEEGLMTRGLVRDLVRVGNRHGANMALDSLAPRT